MPATPVLTRGKFLPKMLEKRQNCACVRIFGKRFPRVLITKTANIHKQCIFRRNTLNNKTYITCGIIRRFPYTRSAHQDNRLRYRVLFAKFWGKQIKSWEECKFCSRQSSANEGNHVSCEKSTPDHHQSPNWLNSCNVWAGGWCRIKRSLTVLVGS